MRVIFAALTLLAVSSAALAQPRPTKGTPEHLLSADCLVYFRYDGYERHRKAYDQTALAKAMKEGLSEFFDHAFEQMCRFAGGDFPPRKMNQAKGPGSEANGFVEYLWDHGFVLGLDVAPAKQGESLTEELLHLTLVFPQGAEKKNRQALDDFFRSMAATANVSVEKASYADRAIQFCSLGETQQIAWWAEGKHLVLSMGVQPVEKSVRVIEGRRPDLTTKAWYSELAAFKRYETDMRGYINLETVVDRLAIFGLEAPGLENFKHRFARHVLLSHLGLTGLKDLTFHLGFDGKYQRSTVRLGVVEPTKRSGVLSLVSGPIDFAADKLPPLPPDADYVRVLHVDWNDLYDYIRTSYGLIVVSNLVKNGELPTRFPNLDRLLGVDFRKDFLDQLDTTMVTYGGHSEGPFFLGQGFAVKVKDTAKVSKSLESITQRLGKTSERLVVQKKTFRGQTMHVFSNLYLPVTFTVHKDWLVVGLFPQPVQGFLLRSGGKYRVWKAPPELEEVLAKERKEKGAGKLLGVSVSDPRPAIEMGLALLPVIIHWINPETPLLDISKIPNAQTVNEWVFPNVRLFYDDGKALRWENHYSINEPDDFLLFLFSPWVGEFFDFIPFDLPAPEPRRPRIQGRENIAPPKLIPVR